MVQSTRMKPTIVYEDFDKIDIRIGTILSASAPEWSSKLLRFEVDFGEEIGKRVIFSGIKQWYSPDTFVGKQFPFLINLAPKKMGPEESQGMMLMADGEKPTVFSIEKVAEGAVIR
jgi:methionyl-tRNA synthetase